MIAAPREQLTRLRFHMLESIVAKQARAMNLLFLQFSTYKKANPFSDQFGKASAAVLDQFTSE